jgi:hypothetical protein
MDLGQTRAPLRRAGSTVTEKSLRAHSHNPQMKKAFYNNDISTIKEALNEEGTLDMSRELHRKKKKIVLKTKVFNFESMGDIMEEREHNQKQEEEQDLIERKKVLGEDYFNERKDIPAYSKKVFLKKKQCYEDLMLEDDLVLDSSDNEEVVLERLQGMYNKPHRSNIFVTGTLSIVTGEKAKDFNKKTQEELEMEEF